MRLFLYEKKMNEMHSMFCSLADGGAVLTKKGEVVVLIARILDI